MREPERVAEHTEHTGTEQTRGEPIDPDVDLHVPVQRQELRRTHGAVLAAVAAGGAVGACARYGAGLLFPEPAQGFPLTTVLVNVVGCALLGALMVLVTEQGAGHPLLRPFAGTGVLGGFTTFSTSVVQAQQLVAGGRPGLGLLALFGTLMAALLAVLLGVWTARAVLR